MVLFYNDVIDEWEVNSAFEFDREFELGETFDPDYGSDEEYMVEWLEKSDRKFTIDRIEQNWDCYWKIREIR